MTPWTWVGWRMHIDDRLVCGCCRKRAPAAGRRVCDECLASRPKGLRRRRAAENHDPGDEDRR